MLLATLLMFSLPQSAASVPQTCPAVPVELPRWMEGWRRPTSATAGAGVARAATLAIGSAATATLLPAAGVTYAVRPEKPGASDSRGGVFAFTVKTPGRYRVALGTAAWIDVVRGTTPVASVAHGHGPTCSTIRKMVDFDLQPGRYLLQIAGSKTRTLIVMVAPVA